MIVIGAGQAIVDRRAWTDRLLKTENPDAILRQGHLRTADKPFGDIAAMIGRDELAAISNSCKRVAGCDRETLARRE